MRNTTLALATAIVLTACGGTTTPPQDPTTDDSASHARPKSNIQVKSEFGTIDKGDSEKALRSLSPRFMKCQEDRLGAVEVISGNVKFFIMVGEDGKSKFVYFEESELGDRETEKCLIDHIMAVQFPKPDGGEAIVRYAIELPQRAARAPDAWDADKVSKALGDADHCSTSGAAQVTAYVVQGEKKAGKVVAVGVALPEKGAESKIDCVVKAVKEMKLPTPGGYIAKVSFKI